MTQSGSRPFEHVPPNAGGHFVIYLYAAVYRLINHVRRLGDAGGPSLEQVFEKYPFLAEYFAEMRRHMPEGLTWEEGTDWWQRAIEGWEADCSVHLPLRALARQEGIGFRSRLAFLAVGLIEEDSRFGTVFAELQQPIVERRPTLELVGQIMMDEALAGETDPWTLCRPLLAAGLVEAPDRTLPRSEWVLRAPHLLWDAARGQVELRPTPWCRYYPLRSLQSLNELILPEDILRRLAKVPELIRSRKAEGVILRSAPGADPEQAVGAVANALGRQLVVAEGAALAVEESARLVGSLCTLTQAVPVLSYDLGPGETARPPALGGYSGPRGFLLGLEGGLTGEAVEKVVTLTLPPPAAPLRERHWRHSLNGVAVDDLQAVVDNFHLAGGYIRQVAQIAVAHAGLDGRDAVGLADVREAARSLNRQLLDTLADHLEARGGWEDLVAAESTTAKMQELEQRCHHRERVLERLGPAFGGNVNWGVRALFTGTSGTGKTLAARILAAELGMDLYRVDLAAVVNKYIGETEKNLHQVLSRAEALDVVLLLDEGDALLGHRTQVKSANDRYANLETNYLLQRLENYRGIVVVTTNLNENIDPAFQRRMDVVVPFFPPQPAERLRILLLHLPADHDVDPTFLEAVASRCALNGGQLRNAAFHAALSALDNGGMPVQAHHLEEGLRSEYRKAGGTFPLAGSRYIADHDGGMQTFVAALGGN